MHGVQKGENRKLKAGVYSADTLFCYEKNHSDIQSCCGTFSVCLTKSVFEFQVSLKLLYHLSSSAVDRALTYLDTGRIPAIWEENSSDVIVHGDSEEDTKKVHSSEDESSIEDDGEKKTFKEKLLTFMEEKGWFTLLISPIFSFQAQSIYM